MRVYEPMEDSTPIKQWRASLDRALEASSVLRKDDLVRLIHLSQQSLDEISVALIWLGEQEKYVASMYKELASLHRTRFNEEPPPRNRDKAGAEVVLDTTAKRVASIRQVALALAKPGEQVTDKQILEELQRHGMRLLATNSPATVSTVIYGFRTAFTKSKAREVSSKGWRQKSKARILTIKTLLKHRRGFDLKNCQGDKGSACLPNYHRRSTSDHRLAIPFAQLFWTVLAHT